jgi:hypothetical protein
MATKEMNMHRLLSELKMLDKRISGYIMPNSRTGYMERELALIGAARESDKMIGTQTRKEYTSMLAGNWQMIRALIRNKKALEAAKVKSNAETVVSIAGKEYTVADAIRRKDDIEYDKLLLALFETQHRQIVTMTADKNEEAQRQADKHVEALWGVQGAAKAAGKIEQPIVGHEAEQQRENYLKNHRWAIIDPNGSDEAIRNLRDEIDAFEAEVDAVLSESNAVTMVSVELID